MINNNKFSKMIQNIEGTCVQYFATQIQKIEKEINHIDQTANKAITALEEQKRKIRKQSDPNAIYSKNMTEISKFIQCIPKLSSMENCDEVKSAKSVEEEQAEMSAKYSVHEIAKTLAEMDRQISYVQSQHDKALLDLERKKETLKQRLSSIGKLDLLVNVLTFKIFETQHEHRKELDELLLHRENIMNKTDMTENQIALKVAELDRKISDVKNTHEATMMSLEGQRTELRKEAAMKIEHLDFLMVSLKEQHEIMLAELESHKVEASQLELEETDRRIHELNRMFLNDVEYLERLQADGWKEHDSQEKISDILEARGIRVTKSGHFLTMSGQHLTRSQASSFGYLDGIDVSSWDDLLKDGVLKNLTGGGNDATDTSSTASTESRMASEDIHYLKTVLGKPLTLALAEITAKQPRDPIHYLGHWLLKYRYNQEVDTIKKHEIQELIEERERLEREALHTMIEEEARAAILNMVIRAEEEAIQEELERIAREAAMMENEDNQLEAEARDVLGAYDGPTAGKRPS